jgi:transcription elongation GreA/GreB family factor
MAPSLPDKDAVVAALLTQVTDELTGVEAMAEATRDEATSAETKSEGKYDTRATEASYLARGQAWRIIELRKFATWLSAEVATRTLAEPVVQVGALVQVIGARSEVLYIAPVGGGKATIGDITVRTISPSSPLGEAMVELEVGDGFEVDSPRGLLAFEVSAIG